MRCLTLLWLCTIFMLAGCKNKQVASRKKSQALAKHSHYLEIDEARLVDIPFPLQSKLYGTIDTQSGNQYITFESQLSSENLMSLYHSEMERLGWSESGVFSPDQELLLIYEKPHKICVISSLDHTIKIFLGPKNLET